MALENAKGTKVRVLADARAQGLEAEEHSDFVSAVEQGLADVESGRIRPARGALKRLGAKLGFSS
jgi:predicted transcriptional regulator